MYFFIYGACLLSVIILPIVSLVYGVLSAIYHFQNSVRKGVISFFAIIGWFLAAGNLIAGNISFDTIKWALLVGFSVAVLCVLMFVVSFWISRKLQIKKNK